MKKSFIKWILVTLVIMIWGTLTSVAIIEEGTYRLNKGVEYMDKTFVYELESTDTDKNIVVLCIEKDAPTYDSKKGLMTWIDYKSYMLEEIFTVDKANQIRAIIEVAGPQLNEEEVVVYLKETTGIAELTYDEVVSAIQYSVWFYSDNDFRIPSTSNGEDLYRFFLTLPPAQTRIEKDIVDITVADPIRDNSENVIIFKYHYSSKKPSMLAHTYYPNIMMIPNVSEVIEVVYGVTYVTVKVPIESDDVSIDFDVEVKGTIKNVGEVTAFVPEVRGSSQMLVGYNQLVNKIQVGSKTATMSYKSYQLILNDDGDITKNGFTDGEFVSVSRMNELNQVGKDGYLFIGWFDKQNMAVIEGVTMDKNHELYAKYKSDNPTNGSNPEGSNPDGSNPDEGNPDVSNPDEGNPDEGNPDGSNPDGSNPDEGNPDGSNPDEGNPDGSNPDGSNPDGSDPDVSNPDEGTADRIEEFPDAEIPEETPSILPGWIPKTGGVPLLIFLVVGSVSISIGLVLRRLRVRKF